ncbi:MAG: mycofactocin system glycosyltransferase [Actinobacteria bacterium]|nr:mycofactocin system glycosyltransferase [Actinomycetota bacterium]
MTTPLLRCDALWSRQGDQLIAGSPARFFRLTENGVEAAKALETGASTAPKHAPLADRLIAAGALHPYRAALADPSQITVVIPAYLAEAHQRKQLRELISGLEGLSVIIIDDASPSAIELMDAKVVRLDTNSGPAAARNRGLELASTPLVAFVDCDVHITRDDICKLAAQIDDQTKIVAPRIVASKRRSLLAQYERNSAPLDMGQQPAKVTHDSRVSYLASAVLVCDTATLRDAGGFDVTLRCGEDVDLVWRLLNNEITVRYEPSINCQHDTRRGLVPFLRQRFNYGSSSVDLESRHPGRLSPLRSRPTSVATWLLLGIGLHVIALAFLLLDFAFMSLQFRERNISTRLMLKMFGKNFLNTGQHFADAIVKVWWPVIVVTATLSDAVSSLLALCIVIPGLIAYARRPTLDPFSFLFLRTLEKFAYGAGVWVKGFSVHNLNALRPRFLSMSNSSVSG